LKNGVCFLICWKVGTLLDAVRASDGRRVGLKKVNKADHPFEAEIHAFFSSEPLISNPDNHCVPLYDVMDHPSEPDIIILVMPYLRKYDSPAFHTIGESVEFFRQAFKGLQFMHSHRVAHRYVSFSITIS
jgi:serine/threonine protein kinase